MSEDNAIESCFELKIKKLKHCTSKHNLTAHNSLSPPITPEYQYSQNLPPLI